MLHHLHEILCVGFVEVFETSRCSLGLKSLHGQNNEATKGHQYYQITEGQQHTTKWHDVKWMFVCVFWKSRHWNIRKSYILSYHIHILAQVRKQIPDIRNISLWPVRCHDPQDSFARCKFRVSHLVFFPLRMKQRSVEWNRSHRWCRYSFETVNIVCLTLFMLPCCIAAPCSSWIVLLRFGPKPCVTAIKRWGSEALMQLQNKRHKHPHPHLLRTNSC